MNQGPVLRWVAIACATAVACGGRAAAAERGFYVAPAYSFNTIDVNKAEVDALFESAFALEFDESSLDRSTRGLSLGVGYQFTPYLAVEGAWIDLGKLRYDFSFTDETGQQLARISNRSSGMAFAAVGSLPLGPYFSVDARLGALFGENKLRLADRTTGDSSSVSDRKTALFFGAGITWMVTPYTGVYASVARFNKGSFEADVDQFAIGLRYSYGD